MPWKNVIIYFFVLISALTFMICSCNSKSNNNSGENVSCEAESDIDEEALVKEFLNDLYTNYVFGHDDFEGITTHFSPSIITELRDKYDYDGDGYAVWLFRSGAQDGPSPVSCVNNITLLSDGWYKVEVTDMGYAVSCRFKACVEDGSVIVTAFENPDYNN